MREALRMLGIHGGIEITSIADIPAKGTHLDITVEARDREHAQKILASFAAEGFAPQRIAAGVAMR